MHKIVRPLLVGAVALACSDAHAAGFYLQDQSAKYEGAAFAGATARADDPSTLFYNPAGMANLPGYQFSLNGAAISPVAKMSSGTATRNTLLGGSAIVGTTGRDAGVDAFLPSLYATAQVGQSWHVGLSVTSPFGLVTKYDTSSIGRYYALTSSLKTVNIAPSVAWQIMPTLAVGASLMIETADAHLSNGVDYGSALAAKGVPPSFGGIPGGADGIATLKGSDTSVGWQTGILFEPQPDLHIGVDYRSAIVHKLTGTVTFSGVPLLAAQAFQNSAAVAKLPEPEIIALGASKDLGPVTLLADLHWTGWSRFKQLLAVFNAPPGNYLTPENWHDTWTFALGADYRVNDQFTLRAGTAWDETPVRPADRTPRIPDASRYWLSIGATWAPMKNVELSVAYAHLFAGNATVSLVDQGGQTASNPNFLRGNLNATFNESVDIGTVQATVKF